MCRPWTHLLSNGRPFLGGFGQEDYAWRWPKRHLGTVPRHAVVIASMRHPILRVVAVYCALQQDYYQTP